jgi:hypothetical protein
MLANIDLLFDIEQTRPPPPAAVLFGGSLRIKKPTRQKISNGFYRSHFYRQKFSLDRDRDYLNLLNLGL